MDDNSKNERGEQDHLPFGFQRKPIDGRIEEENWKGVDAAIRQLESSPVRNIEIEPAGAHVIPWGKMALAAACLLFIAFGMWWIGARTGHSEIAEYKTGYGEIKNILLPDSSVVILNANSSLRIAQQWKESEGRQVWLEGEAYFQVRKQPSTSQKFIVHTKQLDVEVLGTKFNVNTRRERYIVSLEEGKVQLSMNGSVTSVLEKKLIMKPGQVVEIDANHHARLNEDKDVVTRSGWSRHEFHFDNTSLSEIADMVRDTYGYEMVVEDSSMLGAMISGDVRVANMDELRKVLEASFGYALRMNGKTIYVTSH